MRLMIIMCEKPLVCLHFTRTLSFDVVWYVGCCVVILHFWLAEISGGHKFENWKIQFFDTAITHRTIVRKLCAIDLCAIKFVEFVRRIHLKRRRCQWILLTGKRVFNRFLPFTSISNAEYLISKFEYELKFVLPGNMLVVDVYAHKGVVKCIQNAINVELIWKTCNLFD